MARPKNLVPSLRHHKASNQAFVLVSGQTIYLGKWGTKAAQQRYARFVAEWTATGRAPSFTAPSLGVNDDCITVTELVAHWMRFAKSYYRKDGKSTRTAENMVPTMAIVRRLYGAVPVTEFGSTALKVCRNQMVEQGNARTYVNDQVNRIRRMFRWGVEEELVPSSVYEALRAVAPLRKGRL